MRFSKSPNSFSVLFFWEFKIVGLPNIPYLVGSDGVWWRRFPYLLMTALKFFLLVLMIWISRPVYFFLVSRLRLVNCHAIGLLLVLICIPIDYFSDCIFFSLFLEFLPLYFLLLFRCCKSAYRCLNKSSHWLFFLGGEKVCFMAPEERFSFDWKGKFFQVSDVSTPFCGLVLSSSNGVEDLTPVTSVRGARQPKKKIPRVTFWPLRLWPSYLRTEVTRKPFVRNSRQWESLLVSVHRLWYRYSVESLAKFR